MSNLSKQVDEIIDILAEQQESIDILAEDMAYLYEEMEIAYDSVTNRVEADAWVDLIVMLMYAPNLVLAFLIMITISLWALFTYYAKEWIKHKFSKWFTTVWRKNHGFCIYKHIMAGSRNASKNRVKTIIKQHDGRDIVPVMVAGKGRGAHIGARYKDDEFSLIVDHNGRAIAFKLL